MNATDVIGWVSSGVLVLTLGQQVKKQWDSKSTEGVSRWLFIGQLMASIGFTIYSVLLKNWVFVVTNALMIVNAVVGGLIVLHSRRRANRESRPGGADDKAAPGASPA